MKEVYNQLLQAIIEQLKTENIPYGAMYILPDGMILDLSLLENGHVDLWAHLNERIPTASYPQENIIKFLRDLGWIKANTKEKYVETNCLPTEQQKQRIKRILKVYPASFEIKL